MNFFFDTNFYRDLTKDIKSGRINFNELKTAEIKNNHKIIFSNVVAIELINHLDKNDIEKKECLEALNYLTNHISVKKTESSLQYGIVPTFHHILTKYFFNKKSKYDVFNKNIFKVSQEIFSTQDLENEEIKRFIRAINQFKIDERNELIQNLEECLIKPWSNNENELNWESLKGKNKRVRKNRQDFNEQIESGYFHDLLALSFFNLACQETYSETTITPEIFMKDYKISLDFFVKEVLSKIGEVNGFKDYFSKKWNSFYDLQLILGLEYYNKFSETILVTDDGAIKRSVNGDNKILVLCKEDYFKTLSL